MPPPKTFIEELPEALDLWRRQGLIGGLQARRILAQYGLAPQTVDEARRTGRLASIVGVLGALLMGTGVILLVASNWERLDRPQKLALLLAALVAAYGAGYWLKSGRGNYPRIGGALVFLGSILFGANLFLVAQTYHVPANEPLLLAAWAAGALGVAYASASRPALYLAILAALAWYSFQLAAWHFERLGTASIVGLAAFIPLGLLLLGAGEVQRSFRRTEPFSSAFVRLGLVVALAPMVLFSYADFWRSLVAVPPALGDAQGLEVAATQLNASYGAFAALALFVTLWAARRFGPAGPATVQAAGVLVIGGSSLLVVFHPFQRAEAYALVFNVVLLVAVLWAIVVGLWTRRESFINLGLLFFVLLVISRYFDFFFSLLDRSMAFIGAGALLLVGGYLLERSRRHLLRVMAEEGNTRDGT